MENEIFNKICLFQGTYTEVSKQYNEWIDFQNKALKNINIIHFKVLNKQIATTSGRDIIVTTLLVDYEISFKY